MILYFENRNEVRTELGRDLDQPTCFKLISQFLKEHNFESRYYRITTNDNYMWIDFGSHIEFFYIYLQEGDTFNLNGGNKE